MIGVINRKKFKNTGMKIVVYLILVVGLLTTSTSCKYFKKQRLFSKDIDTLLDADIAQKTDIDTTSMLEEEILEPLPPQATVSAPVKKGYGTDKYYMIVGSFQSENFANRYAEKIRQMGYTSQVLQSSDGYFRVSAKSYSNYRTGVNEIEDFRNSVTANAWLHIHN